MLCCSSGGLYGGSNMESRYKLKFWRRQGQAFQVVSLFRAQQIQRTYWYLSNLIAHKSTLGFIQHTFLQTIFPMDALFLKIFGILQVKAPIRETFRFQFQGSTGVILCWIQHIQRSFQFWYVHCLIRGSNIGQVRQERRILEILWLIFDIFGWSFEA